MLIKSQMQMLLLTDDREPSSTSSDKLNEDHSDDKYKSRLQDDKHEEYTKA